MNSPHRKPDSRHRHSAGAAVEDTHGPINLIAIIGALIPFVALGGAMPARSGWLLAAAAILFVIAGVKASNVT